MTGNPIPKDDNHTKESNHELIWKELKKKKKTLLTFWNR